MAGALFQGDSHLWGRQSAGKAQGPSRVATIPTRRQRRRKLPISTESHHLCPLARNLLRTCLSSAATRALTGSQAHGDAFVRATLEAIVAQPDEFPRDVDPRLGLYKTFHAIWSTANIEEGEEPSMSPTGAEGIAHARLSRITPLRARRCC